METIYFVEDRQNGLMEKKNQFRREKNA